MNTNIKLTTRFLLLRVHWDRVITGPNAFGTKRIRLPPTYHFNILKARLDQVFQELAADAPRTDHQHPAGGEGVGELFAERTHQLCHCRLGVWRTSGGLILRGGKRSAARAHARKLQNGFKRGA